MCPRRSANLFQLIVVVGLVTTLAACNSKVIERQVETPQPPTVKATIFEPELNRSAARVTLVQDAKVAAAPTPLTAETQNKAKQPDESDLFFRQGMIPQLKIVLSQQEEQKLRTDQKRFVECTLIENGQTTYKKVAVKLKGAAGSFRNIDDRPALTLKLKKKGDRFHGLDKFHLNNSVQDESYLCEWLGSELCREAGCPATRVTHARVWLNDRDLGFYVLKEGFDESFLERNFANAKGNLYDGGFCVDIDANLEKDTGEGPDDMGDLKALVAACREGDENRRNQRVAELLDVEAFLNFVAMERLLCHWDGYVNNRNNYRLYFRADDKKAIFLPHGMDQLFQDTGFAVFQDAGPIVANPVLRNFEWKAKYRRRVKELVPLFEAPKLHAKIDAAHARIRPVLATIAEDRARHFDERVKDLKNRVAAREQNLREQIRNLPPEPLLFDKEKTLVVDNWLPKAEADAKLEERNVEGRDCYVVETGPSNRTTASWRRKVLLPRGTYQLEAQGRATNVTPIAGDPSKGMGLRISGSQRENQLAGTTNWEKLSYDLEIKDDAREVELVAELRSTSGSGAFDKGSIKITKIK